LLIATFLIFVGSKFQRSDLMNEMYTLNFVQLLVTLALFGAMSLICEAAEAGPPGSQSSDDSSRQARLFGKL
jgi:hypothetical protein